MGTVKVKERNKLNLKERFFLFVSDLRLTLPPPFSLSYLRLFLRLPRNTDKCLEIFYTLLLYLFLYCMSTAVFFVFPREATNFFPFKSILPFIGLCILCLLFFQ